MPQSDELHSSLRYLHVGIMFGIVEDVDDPEQLGRVRIRIKQLHSENRDEIPTDRLPWAPLVSMGGFTGHGMYWTPVVGSQVAVAFFHGSPEYPVCLGTVYTRGQAPVEVKGRGPDTSSNNPYGTDAFPGSNPDGTVEGAPDTHVLRSPGGRKVVIDDTSEALVLESSLGHLVTLADESSTSRIEFQSAAGHNLTFWDKSGEEEVVLTSAAGHRSLWSDKTSEPLISHTTIGGHLMKMTDKTANPEIRLQTIAGSYLSMSDVGFGGIPEIRVETPGRAQVVMQDASDTITFQTALGSGVKAIADNSSMLYTGTGFFLKLGEASQRINISTPSDRGSIVLTSAGQINMRSLTGTIHLSSVDQITLTGSVINLN